MESRHNGKPTTIRSLSDQLLMFYERDEHLTKTARSFFQQGNFCKIFSIGVCRKSKRNMRKFIRKKKRDHHLQLSYIFTI